MPANLFGTRFHSHRVPAWHNLGTIVETPVSACEALDQIGDYRVSLETISIPSIPSLNTERFAIVREGTVDDPEPRLFGLVGKDYQLITPRDTAQLWDQFTGAKIETMGSLGKGEEFFISTKLPTFDVLGDQVDTYLLAVNPMTGVASAQVRVTPVRVVCQNTLTIAKSVSSENYRIRHDEFAHARFGAWLGNAWGRSQARLKAIQIAFTLLASTRTTTESVQSVLTASYPIPRPPTVDLPAEVYQEREKLYETGKDWALTSRTNVQELFEGKGTGMDLASAQGTLWGLYNSVTEYENYRRSRDNSSRGYNTLFGDRADTMARAYETSIAIASGEPVNLTALPVEP